MKKYLLLLILCVLPVINIYAQVHPPVRVEFAVAENASPFTMENLGEHGVLVMMLQTNLNDKAPSRWLMLYSHYLQRKWAVNLDIPNVYAFKSYTVVGDSLNFVLSSLPDQTKSNQFALVKVDLNTGGHNYSYLNFPSIPKCNILATSVTATTLWFLAKDKNSYRLNKYNLQTQEWQSKNLALSEEQEFLDFYMDTINQTHCFLFRQEKFSTPNLTIVGVDSALEILYTTPIGTHEDGKRLANAKLQFRSKDQCWLVGTYNSPVLKVQSSAYDNEVISTGLFACIIEKGAVRKMNYLPYFKFNYFDTLLSRPQWFEYNKSKEKSKGKVVDYQTLSFFKLAKKKEQTYCSFLAQTYQRNETTVSDMYYDYYGRMVPQTRIIFEGFSYHDAMLAFIDSNAQIHADWLGSLGQSSLLYRALDFVADVKSENLQKYYVLLNQNSFVFYHYNESQRRYERDRIKLETLSKADQIENTWNNQILYVGEGKFIAYGYQQIKNPTQVKSIRNVFYMTLVQIDE